MRASAAMSMSHSSPLSEPKWTICVLRRIIGPTSDVHTRQGAKPRRVALPSCSPNVTAAAVQHGLAHVRIKERNPLAGWRGADIERTDHRPAERTVVPRNAKIAQVARLRRSHSACGIHCSTASRVPHAAIPSNASRKRDGPFARGTPFRSSTRAAREMITP